MSRIVNNVKGGMTLSTTLLTTYIPPQIDAAANPDNKPGRICLWVISRLYLSCFGDYGNTMVLIFSWDSGK